jgi:hypothetical protein
MLTRKKSIGTRPRRPSRKRAKFITPHLTLFAGKLMRHVANPDNALSEAERLRGAYAEMKERQHAEVRHFLQRIYGVAARFRRRPGDFERFQVHPFWKETGQKPKDPSTSRWALYFIMQARTPNACDLADKKAVILDGLMQDKVEDSAVAARIEELGGIGAAYEAIASKPSLYRGHQVQGGPLGKSASSRPASTSGQRSLVVARRSPPKRPPLNQRALNSRAKLDSALDQIRAEMRSAEEVLLQLQQEEDFLLEWKESRERNILRLKRERREKKKADHLKRMGGRPLGPLIMPK